MVVEANLVENKTYWVLDTVTSKHLCANKELFHYLEDVVDGECVYMGNTTTTRVLIKGKVFLKLTSRKTLALNNVLYVPSLCRNLVSGNLLNKAGLKNVFEADNVIWLTLRTQLTRVVKSIILHLLMIFQGIVRCTC